MPTPYKLCQEWHSKRTQRFGSVKVKTKWAKRKFRRLEKNALKKEKEPPVSISTGDRY